MLLDPYNNQISAICEKHKVKRLYAFGSVLTEKFSEASDIDLMVDFHSVDLQQYADNYFSFKFALEKTLNRPVDLLEEKAIKNPYFKKSCRTATPAHLWKLKSKPGLTTSLLR